MKIKAGTSFDEITGDVLIGLTATGKLKKGEWLHCTFVRGQLTATAELDDPATFKGRLDVLAEDVNDDRPPCDLKVAVKAASLVEVQADVVGAFQKGSVYVLGDESFFIRYSPDILLLIAQIEP